MYLNDKNHLYPAIDLKSQDKVHSTIAGKLKYSENPNIFELKTKIAEKIISENRYCF